MRGWHVRTECAITFAAAPKRPNQKDAPWKKHCRDSRCLSRLVILFFQCIKSVVTARTSSASTFIFITHCDSDEPMLRPLRFCAHGLLFLPWFSRLMAGRPAVLWHGGRDRHSLLTVVSQLKQLGTERGSYCCKKTNFPMKSIL
jgi:hypothetical protein